MLSAKREKDGKKVLARHISKEEGPFNCPGCGKDVNLRKGQIKIHHFAHKPPFRCRFGAGETDAHRKCKETIYEKLLPLKYVSDCELEKNFGSNVADVFAVINNVPVAIEIQKSNLSVNEIIKRTRSYHEKGIYVLWLCLFNKKLNNDAYSPKAWEKWLHATYFGRVYYWVADLTVLPVHFSDYSTYVEEKSYYDSSGYENYSGGYFKTSKRYKTPKPGKAVNIAASFKPSFKKSWESKTLTIPECSIYTDNQPVWWKKA